VAQPGLSASGALLAITGIAMEQVLGAVCCTDGRNYSVHECQPEALLPDGHAHLFDFGGDSSDRHARSGNFEAWPDSRKPCHWHSLARTARLPLGTTNHVRRFSPFVEGQW
jgi:hypothetical protein